MKDDKSNPLLSRTPRVEAPPITRTENGDRRELLLGATPRVLESLNEKEEDPMAVRAALLEQHHRAGEGSQLGIELRAEFRRYGY